MAAPPGSAPLARRPPDLDGEDDEIELPPLDDDEDEPDAPLDELDELDEPDDEGGLDDADASELDIGEQETTDEEPTGGDEASEDSVDVGALDEEIDAVDGEVVMGDAADGIQGEDDEIDELPSDFDDGGAEGTDEPIEDEVDDALLPELDADEEGDFEELSLSEGIDGGLDEALPPWDAAPWATREGSGASVPCRAIAVGHGRVAAAGDVVLVIDDGAHAARRAAFEAAGDAIALYDDAILVATARGQILEAKGDADATAVTAFRGRRGPISLASSPGRAWALQEGAIWSLAGAPLVATLVHVRGAVAIAASGPVLVALDRAAGEPSLARLRGDDEGWQAKPIDGPARVVALGDEVRLAAAAAGLLVAMADPAAGVAISRDGGISFRTLPIASVVALDFAGDDDDAPLLVVIARELEGSLFVAQLAARGAVTLIAELSIATEACAAALEELGGMGAATLAWDPARDVAWIACRSGLVAIGRPRPH